MVKSCASTTSSFGHGVDGVKYSFGVFTWDDAIDDSHGVCVVWFGLVYAKAK